MAGKVIATFIFIVTFVVIAGNMAFTQTDTRELERRIGVVEKEMKSLSTYVKKRAKVTLKYFQEAERTIGDAHSKISSLEKRVSELGEQQEDMRLRVERLEVEILELKRNGIAAKETEGGTNIMPATIPSSWRGRKGAGDQAATKEEGAGTSLFMEGDSNRRQVRETTEGEMLHSDKYNFDSLRQLRQQDTIYVFIFEAYSKSGAKTEIRYSSFRRISPEDIRWPDYMVRDIESIRLVDSRVLPPLFSR